jgi:hypothetical protein
MAFDIWIELLEKLNTAFRSRVPQAVFVQEEVDAKIGFSDYACVCDCELPNSFTEMLAIFFVCVELVYLEAPGSSTSQLQQCQNRSSAKECEHPQEPAVHLLPKAEAVGRTSSPCLKVRGGLEGSDL